MGKIKTKMIKRTANDLMDSDLEFSEDFENNKNILGNKMPSKKTRNQIAGLITRIKTQEREESEKMAVKK